MMIMIPAADDNEVVAQVAAHENGANKGLGTDKPLRTTPTSRLLMHRGGIVLVDNSSIFLQ